MCKQATPYMNIKTKTHKMRCNKGLDEGSQKESTRSLSRSIHVQPDGKMDLGFSTTKRGPGPSVPPELQGAPSTRQKVNEWSAMRKAAVPI